LAAIETLDDFDPVYLNLVGQQVASAGSSRPERLATERQKEARVRAEIANVLAFIRGGTQTQSLRDELNRLEAELRQIVMKCNAIEQEPTDATPIPSLAQLKQIARQSMARQATTPYEFGRIMRELIPKIRVFPYRLCDGGGTVLRAQFTLSLASLLTSVQCHDDLDKVLSREMTVDLFDPPQREAHRREIIFLRAQGLTEKTIAQQLDITITAAQRAAALQRRMDQLGLSDAYIPVTVPREDTQKSWRHLHPRYKFEPLEEDE
jgi:hypothetical protein